MMCRRSPARSRGGVAPFLAICLVALIGVMALSLDGGLLMHQQVRAQTAADAAALAAADSLFLYYRQNSGLDPNGSARQAALAVASAGGYSNDGVNSTVTVNIPPLSGNFTGKKGYAEVVIQFNQQRCFSKIWGSSPLSVTTRAVARGSWTPFGNGVVVLDPTMPSALNLTGGGTLNVQNASVVVDSNNSQAASSGGGSSGTATEFDIVGGYSNSNGGTFNGTMNTSSSPVPDPLAYLPPPDPSTLTTQSTKKLSISGGNVTLQPGVYSGGIAISGSASVTLSPGIYYMDTGGFSFNGDSLVGDGVMIYNAPAPKGSSDNISINGSSSSTVNLTPPTSGVYQGVSLFQDRNSTQPLKVTGNGNFSITGTFYAAAAQLSITGNGAVSTIGSQYISDSLKVAGTGAINIAWTTNNTARTRYIGLVE